jgi:large subunit ribosomal protein L4
LKSALSAKYEAYEIYVVEDLKMDEIKTATIAKMLKGMEIDSKALIVTANVDENVYKSARNIKGVTPTYVDVLNSYEILKHDKFIISKDAVAKIEEVLS